MVLHKRQRATPNKKFKFKSCDLIKMGIGGYNRAVGPDGCEVIEPTVLGFYLQASEREIEITVGDNTVFVITDTFVKNGRSFYSVLLPTGDVVIEPRHWVDEYFELVVKS